MNPALSALLLAIPCGLLGLLVILPALREWRWPEDTASLNIDQMYSRQDAIFAARFRALAGPWWQGPQAQDHGPVRLKAGTVLHRYLLVESLTTGAGTVMEEEVWTKADLRLGAGSQARALLSDHSIHVERDCLVHRWVHGELDVVLKQGVQVSARITAGERISLSAGCRSPFISAPLVEWASSFRSPMGVAMPSHRGGWRGRQPIRAGGSRAGDLPRQGKGPAFVTGDFILEADADVPYSLVVLGNLYLREGAHIAGDVKAHGDLVVDGATVQGNLCCGGRLSLGAGSRVQGCLRGDAMVCLGDGVVVGAPDRAVAVVGNRILLSGRGRVHGHMRALAGWIEVDA